MERLQCPRKNVQWVIDKFQKRIENWLRRGFVQPIPRFCTFYVKKWPGRVMHNPHTGGLYHPTIKNVVTTKRYGLPTQECTPSWSPTYTYTSIREYPQSDLALDIFNTYGGDLLLINAFIYEFVNVTIEALVNGDSVTIRRLGRFKPHTWQARNGRNPHTGATVSIPARTQMKFRQSPYLKGRVN